MPVSRPPPGRISRRYLLPLGLGVCVLLLGMQSCQSPDTKEHRPAPTPVATLPVPRHEALPAPARPVATPSSVSTSPLHDVAPAKAWAAADAIWYFCLHPAPAAATSRLEAIGRYMTDRPPAAAALPHRTDTGDELDGTRDLARRQIGEVHSALLHAGIAPSPIYAATFGELPQPNDQQVVIFVRRGPGGPAEKTVAR